jgi:hypothetical protein
MNKPVLAAVFALAISLLFSQACLAFDSDRWLLVNESFKVGGVNYTLIGFSENRDTAVVRTNVSGTITLMLNESMNVLGHNVTYLEAKPNSTYLDKNYNMTDPHNLNEPYRFHIIVDLISAALTAKRAAAKEVQFGDFVEVSVVLKNSGESDLSVTYTEDIPTYYEVEDKLIFATEDGNNEWSGFSPAGQIYWKGTIKAKEQVTLNYTYRLRGFKIGSTDVSLSPGKAEYTYVGKDYAVNVSETKVSIKRPFSLSISLSEDNIKIDENTKFEIALDNAYDSPVNIESLKIYLPETCIPDGKIFDLDDKNAGKEGGYYEWKGTLSGSKNISFDIPVSAKLGGTSFLTAEVKYRYEDYTNSESFSKQLKVQVNPLNTKLSLNITNVKTYDEYKVNFTLLNTNKGLSFRNLQVSLASADLFEPQYFSYPAATYNTPIKSNVFVFEAPWVDAPKRYIISLQGTYETHNTQKMNFSINQTITVNPLQFNKLLDASEIYISGPENSTTLNISFNMSLAGMQGANGSKNYSESQQINDVRITVFSENGTLIASHTLSDQELVRLKTDKSEKIVLSSVLEWLSNVTDQNIEIKFQYNKGNTTYFITKYQNYVKKAKPAVKNQTITPQKPPIQTPPPENKTSLISSITNYTKSGIDNWGPLLILPGGLVVLIAIFMILYFQHVSKKKALIKEGGSEEENTYKRFIESQEIVLTEKQIKERSTGAIIAKNDPKNAQKPGGTQPEQGASQSTQSYGTGIHDAGMMPKKASYNPVDLVPKPSYDFNELEKYIRTCTATGASKKQMKKKLLDSGWMPEVIEVYLK